MRPLPPRPRPDAPIDLSVLLPPFAPIDPASQWLFQLRRLGIRPGLEAITSLLRKLGDPQRKLQSVVVAGTNGKGAASICLAALGRAAGLRTALYTSPHLLSVRERIEVDGAAIGVDDLATLVREHKDRIEKERTTFFESLTALALLYFAERGVQLAVLEAGLGGRLDATNAVPKKGVVLTSVGLDHQELLGSSLRDIALEKLGLAEAGIPFYLAPLAPHLRELALHELGRRGAVAVELSDRVRGLVPVTSLAARGAMQREQALAMVACYADLATRWGWPSTDPAAAYASLRLPARYETYGTQPHLVVDTAHNSQALRVVLEQWQREGKREGRVLVFAAMRGKHLRGIHVRAARAAATILVTAPGWYRARSPHDVAARISAAARTHGIATEVLVPGSVRETLEVARRTAAARDHGSVLVTGSNFLVAEALDRLGVDDLAAAPGSLLWDQGLPLRRRNFSQERAVS